MPMRDLMDLIRFFSPKIKEMQEARANRNLANALTGSQEGGPLTNG